jgi:hypothetical protein
LEEVGIDGIKIIKCIIKKWHAEALSGLLWLKIGTGVGRS